MRRYTRQRAEVHAVDPLIHPELLTLRHRHPTLQSQAMSLRTIPARDDLAVKMDFALSLDPGKQGQSIFKQAVVATAACTYEARLQPERPDIRGTETTRNLSVYPSKSSCAGECVRDPDRPSTVGGGSEGHHLCGDGGTRATAGAARGLRHFIVFSMESISQEVGINRMFSFSMEKSK